MDEELDRIEMAWAARCRIKKKNSIATVWQSAYDQSFPFPTAIMLIDAASNDKLDSTCWKFVKRLNKLADNAKCNEHRKIRMQHHHRMLVLTKTAIKAQESAMIC